jgi:uncharacterized protein
MKRLLVITAFLTAVLASVGAQGKAGAYTVETVPNVRLSDVRQYVSDPSGILSVSARDTINAVCAKVEQKSGVETAVVMLPSIGDADAFDFAQSLFRHWGIGKKAQNNGLLVLFVMDSHIVRFHTGYGLEGMLPDATCKRIQQRYMIPAFREGNWDLGMVQGVRALGSILQNEEPASASDDDEDGFAGFLVLVAIVVGTIIFIVVSGRESTRCPHCHKRSLQKMSSQRLRLSNGLHVIRTTYMCRDCGKIVVRDTPIDNDRRGNGNAAATGFFLGSMLGGGRHGGSFGGTFGGGSTGGGGASSGW